MMKILRDLFNGFAFGLANIIPGVSGGTFALVLGFYERLIGFLKRLNAASIRGLLHVLFRWIARITDSQRRKDFFGYLRQEDWPWMLRIGGGAIACIFLLSSLMEYLLDQHFELTYSFFFGLIALSIGVPWMLIKAKSASVWISLFLGVAITVGIAAAVNPCEKAKAKSEVYRVKYEAQQVSGTTSVPEVAPTDVKFKYTGKYSAGDYAMILGSGVVAVSAMVLPGVSGSLVLILLGQYFTVIRSISNIRSLMVDEFALLGTFSIGMVVGLLVTARLVELALRKAHDGTMGFLTGLIIGSFYALWPFKKFEILDLVVREGSYYELQEGVKVYSNINQLPGDAALWAPALAIMLAGAAVMWGMMRLDRAHPTD